MMHVFFKGIDWIALQEKKITPPFKPQVLNETEHAILTSSLLAKALS
jgi:hypothetical protein